MQESLAYISHCIVGPLLLIPYESPFNQRSILKHYRYENYTFCESMGAFCVPEDTQKEAGEEFLGSPCGVQPQSCIEKAHYGDTLRRHRKETTLENTQQTA